MAANFWQNVAVYIESALAAAKTVTAITQASEGVVSSTAHGYSGGDYIKMFAQGMYQLNNRVVRVKSGPATDSWTMEGVKTSSFGAFSSGTSKKITFGYTLATATDVEASGGDPEFADITTIHDNVKKQAPVSTSPFSISFPSIFDPLDTALLALKDYADALAEVCVMVQWPSGARIMFSGYCSAPLIPTGSAGEVVKTNVTITSSSRPTIMST